MADLSYGDAAYWDQRYSTKGSPDEWLLHWTSISQVFEKYCGEHRTQWKFLHAGCGNSALTFEMYRAGYRQITSIDNSATVIQQMQEAHGEDGLEWFCMDVGEMSLAEQSFDVVIEKGLLDCLACMEDAHLATAKCMKEVIRILKFDGFFFCISFNHQRAPSLTSAPYHFRLCELQRTAALGAEYYVYVFQKASASILSLWPSYWRDLRLRLSEEDYRLIDQEGTWTDALDAQVGDVLEVVEDFDSGDQEAVRLTRGLRGILHFRDRDGDAMVRFPRLDAESVDRFVFEEDVRCSMRKRVAQQQPAAKKGAERLLRALESESGFSRNH